MTQGTRASLFLPLVLLGGCVLPPPVPGGAPEPVPVSSAVAASAAPPAFGPMLPPVTLSRGDADLRELLAFHDRVRQLGPQDLASEIARLNEEPPVPRTTLQLALLLGQTRSNGDLARALALLDALLRSTAPEAAPWQPLARLLARGYAEQRRLEEQLERQNQQARDSQRKLEQLNEKLEALKAIERNLTTRPPAGGAASAPLPAKGPVP